MQSSRFLSAVLTIAVGLVALPVGAQSKDKKKKPAPKDPQDTIEVVGHIQPSQGPVTRFLTTQHYSSYYLYVEYAGGKNVTLVDVSKTTQPVVLADVPVVPDGGSVSLFAVAGTAALTTEKPVTQEAVAPQTMRIMDFSDPQHPKIAREFTGVTAMSRDDRRGLIFLGNSEGVWILHQTFALDPEVEKEYAHHVIYDH